MDLVLINTYSSLLSGLFMAGLGIFVFLRNPKRKLAFVFLFFCSVMANWLLSTFMMYESKTDAGTIFWDRMVYIGVVFIPVLMYHFGLVFTNSERRNKKKLYLGYFLSFVFIVLSRTDYFVTDLYRYSWGAHTQARFFHHLFLVFFFSYILSFLFEIYKFFKITKQKKEITEINQAKYLFVAFITLNVGAYAFLPAYRININPLGAYWLEIIAVSILAFAITKYHLFEIRVLLTELLVGVMAIILLGQIFLNPNLNWKISSLLIFLLFCIFGYYLIKATHEESKRREYAERLVVRERAMRQKLERLSRAREQVLLSAQHYFRTPLTSIIGYASLILEGTYGEISQKVKEKLISLQKSTKELHRRIEESLDITQFQLGKEILNLEEVQPEELIKEVSQELKFQAEQKGLYLKCELEKESLPKIKADKKRLREVISNLVDNAIKHTLHGGITIKIKEQRAKTLLIEVSDTGIGISAEEMEYIGTMPFERGSQARELTPLGKGIGLYLSKLIIKAHHGELWAESEGKDRGSTFFVELPIRQYNKE